MIAPRYVPIGIGVMAVGLSLAVVLSFGKSGPAQLPQPYKAYAPGKIFLPNIPGIPQPCTTVPAMNGSNFPQPCTTEQMQGFPAAPAVQQGVPSWNGSNLQMPGVPPPTIPSYNQEESLRQQNVQLQQQIFALTQQLSQQMQQMQELSQNFATLQQQLAQQQLRATAPLDEGQSKPGFLRRVGSWFGW